MDIFSKIEGLSGENLSSKLLSYLIFNSHEVRDAILSIFSDNSPNGPITYTSHFSCRTEYPTIDDQYGNGRLDILLQLDDVVIGIESKFFSQFQEDQPQKYCKTLQDVASALKKINHTEVRALLYVLCPESRRSEVKDRITDLNNTAIITWEKIIEKISHIENISNPTARIIASEFTKYLKRQFSFIEYFEKKYIHLKKTFPDYGSPLQGELVRKLWSFFPVSGARLSNGKTWIGYYFYTDPSINEKGWFGFVSKDEIRDEIPHGAEFIVVSTYKPSNLSNRFKKVQLVNDGFIGEPGGTHAWIVKFDDKWNNVDIWREELSPFWSAIKDNDII